MQRGRPKREGGCSICGGKLKGRGLCDRHYQEARRNGSFNRSNIDRDQVLRRAVEFVEALKDTGSYPYWQQIALCKAVEKYQQEVYK